MHPRILVIGTELESPAHSLEAGIFATLKAGLTGDCCELRGLSIHVHPRGITNDDILPLHGPLHGPMWLRKPVYAIKLLQAVNAEIARGVDIVHFVWVGFPVLFRLVQRRFHTAGARSVTTVLNRHAPLERYLDSHRLIAHSPFVLNRMIEMGYPKTKIQILPPPVDESRYFPRCAASKPYFVFASGPRTELQIEERGVMLLFRAFAELQEGGDHTRLAFLNRWPAGEKRLKELAHISGAHNIDFLTGEEVDSAEVIALSRGVILPYCGRVIGDIPVSGIEALACARPVIATRETGISDYIEQTDAGLVIAPHESELVEAIIRLSRDTSHRADAARSLYEQIYTQDFVSTMRCLYLDLLNEPA